VSVVVGDELVTLIDEVALLRLALAPSHRQSDISNLYKDCNIFIHFQ